MCRCVPASTPGFTRMANGARRRRRRPTRSSASSSSALSTLNIPMPARSAKAISDSVFPTPAKTVRPGSPPASSTRASSPPETTSNPEPQRAKRGQQREVPAGLHRVADEVRSARRTPRPPPGSAAAASPRRTRRWACPPARRWPRARRRRRGAPPGLDGSGPSGDDARARRRARLPTVGTGHGWSSSVPDRRSPHPWAEPARRAWRGRRPGRGTASGGCWGGRHSRPPPPRGPRAPRA